MYKSRNLRFEFTAKPGVLDSQGSTSLVIENCKANVKASFAGMMSTTMADVTIYGLGVDLIAAISAKGVSYFTNAEINIGMNIIADNDLVFSGFIYAAYADMNQQPDTGLVISAMAGLDMMRATAKPFSLKGEALYTEIINSICKANGYSYLPVNVSGSQVNAHYEGSPLEQIRNLCLNARLNLLVNGNQVTVWPMGGGQSDVVVKVSPDHGLIGYPVYSPAGLTIQTEFSTLITQGAIVDLTTSLPNTSGKYYVQTAEHYLSSWVKNGVWYTVANITPYNKAVKE